ncbi:MAG: dienelactone hydrolase family protein [Polyangiales bacterium]
MKYALAILLLAAWPLGQVRSAAKLDFVERVLGGPTTEPLPLLIALHGLGDTPEHFAELFEELGVPVRLVLPRAPDPWQVGSSWFPIDDPKRAPGVLLARAKQLAELAAELTKTRKVHGLPVVTGFSQGGCLSYALAAYHSERFRAAVPVAGLLPSKVPAYKKARDEFRVIGFHGADDRRIPLADGKSTVAQLERVGTRATLATYEGVGHGLSPPEERDYRAALRELLDTAQP